MSERTYTCYSTCFKCNRSIAVEYDNDYIETEENVPFLGRLGVMRYHYCPYCGVKVSGFSPYDRDQKMDLSLENDPEEQDDDAEPWWSDAEGVTLIDEDEEDDDDSWDEPEKAALICLSCGKKTWLNPRGCDSAYSTESLSLFLTIFILTPDRN